MSMFFTCNDKMCVRIHSGFIPHVYYSMNVCHRRTTVVPTGIRDDTFYNNVQQRDISTSFMIFENCFLHDLRDNLLSIGVKTSVLISIITHAYVSCSQFQFIWWDS